MKKKIFRNLGPFLGLILFFVVLSILHGQLKNYRYLDIMRQFGALPRNRVAFAVFLTFLSYFALTLYDTLALRHIGHPLPYGKIAFTSFIGYSFSNNVGMSVFSGGSVRYRLYSAWGLSAIDIARVIAFCFHTFWIGFLTVGGIVFLANPADAIEPLNMSPLLVRSLGVIFLSIVAGNFLWVVFRNTPLKIRDWEFGVPSKRIFFSQLAVSSLDWILAGSVLYTLIPSTTLTLPRFLGIYLFAQTAGMLSQIPGGVGVFESIMIALLFETVQGSVIVGSLLAFRVIYYFLPLVIGAALLGANELLMRKRAGGFLARVVGRWFPEIVPHVLTFLTFLSGSVLLFSGATPSVHSRLAWLREFLPLSILEMSHFFGSLVGAGLLILARGLQRRLDAAYVLTSVLLATGIAFSLLKGFDYEEAVALSIMLAALLPCRRYFYRKASLLSERFTAGWISAIALVTGGSIWLGFFSFKHVEYSNELWWHFTIFADAPRFLRASVGAIGALLFFTTRRLLRASTAEPSYPTADELELARPIIEASKRTYVNLAYLGDKSLLFSESGRAFIMYAVEGRSWVALGDPVGPPEEYSELIWRFREMCDTHDGWTVFYQTDGDNFHLYVDLGLMMLKLGEEARVDLKEFSLDGRKNKDLRHSNHRVEKETCEFLVVPPNEAHFLFPDLKKVSDAWLQEKSTREKGFSLGSFDEEYLRHFPFAIVKRDGVIVAFANLWLGADKDELSMDLMRHTSDAPPGVMDYLLIQLMLWGQKNGYSWFNLGMAPLSGLENRSLAPLWSKVGSLVFRWGEHFYNFQGLRNYKEKFSPTWEPKYLVSPGGLALPRILTSISSLIARGFKGVVVK